MDEGALDAGRECSVLPVHVHPIPGPLLVAYHRASIDLAADSAARPVPQNAMINAVGNASKPMSRPHGDPTAMLLHLARAQAATQLNSQSIASASMSSEALPLIRNRIEAMLARVGA